MIKAVCGYKLGEGSDVNDPVIAAIYTMICEQLDADADKYADICEKRSLARKNKKQQMITNDNKCEQMLSSTTDNVVVTRKYAVTYSGFTGSTASLISSIGPEGATISFNSTYFMFNIIYSL